MKSITGISKGSKYLLTIFILFILMFLPVSCGAEEDREKEGEEKPCLQPNCTDAPDLQDITIINEVNPDEVKTYFFNNIKTDMIEISWSGRYIIQGYLRYVSLDLHIPTSIVEEGEIIKIEEEDEIYGKDEKPFYKHHINIFSNKKNGYLTFICEEGEIVFKKAEKKLFGYMKGEIKNLNCIHSVEDINKKLIIKSLKFDGESSIYEDDL